MSYKLSYIFLSLMLLFFSSAGYAQEIVVVVDPSLTDPATGITPDQPMIDTLTAEGYTVTVLSTAAISAESEEFMNTLNNADLVIMGRGINSGTTDGVDKPVWNGIKAPLLVTSPWSVRSNRLGWFNSSSTSQVNDGDSLVALVTMPDDDVFADVTLAADSTMIWVTEAYDIVNVKNGGNATTLAISAADSNILFARFDPWIYFFNGSSDYAAGYRTYIGNGNDAAYPNGPFHYFNYTDEGKSVFFNEVARMVNLPDPPAPPIEISGRLLMLENPSFEQPETRTIDWALIPGWSIDPPSQNSGVEPQGTATDGSNVGFLRSDDGELWKLTPYTIKAGDVYGLFADIRNSWQATDFKLRLFYIDNGSRVTIDSTTGSFTGDSDASLSEYAVYFEADSVQSAIGKTLGIAIDNTTSVDDKYIEMDNFRLYRDGPSRIGSGKEIVFVGLPGKDNPDTPEAGDADKPFIDDLRDEEYAVTTVYSASLETASQGFVDTLNNADLVIIGRSGSSGDFGGSHKAAWNAITSPVLNLHLFTVRSNRLNWLPTETITQFDTAGDTISAKIVMPDDTVFTGVTLAADSTMDWVTTPYDYLVTTSGGNGTVLVRDGSSNVLFVRWDPWVKFYNGANDYAAGYRSYIGNGNDHASSAGGPFNFYNFTDAAKQVYMNEVARMINLPEPPEKPAGLGKTIAFVGFPGKDNPDTPEAGDADKPFIDDLIALEYTVNVVYSTSLSSASQGLVDTLNNADLVIIGRSGSSGDFGSNNPADKVAWNAIRSPVLNLHPYTARNSRLNWLPTATTTQVNTAGDTISAKILIPNDPVFNDATIAADSTMDWVISPYDFIATTDGGNGTVLAREASSSNVLYVRWEPWVEYYDGSGDSTAGYRTLIGNGNDASSPFNFYNFTDEANQVYLNEVVRMADLGKVDPPVSVDDDNSTVPKVYALEQNYPNPFNPTTTIEFALPKNSNVKIAVYDILGRLVTNLVEGNFNAGHHNVQFNASSLASGIYFYRIEAGNFVDVKKLMLLK